MSKANQQTGPTSNWRGFEFLTQIAFVAALGLTVARGTIQSVTRSAGEAVVADAPRGAGAATGLGLDLLCCLPAVLVLARRVSDREYVLRPAWAVLPLAALALWGLLSATWASDKFAALLAAFHWVAAAATVWAGVQLVRSWLRLRVVAAVMFGLLLAYFAYALLFKFVDAPATRKHWEEHKAEILKERGIAPDSFHAAQFEKKVVAGELIGFFKSANSMGAVVVLLLVVSLGLGVQRLWDDRKDAAGVAILAVSTLLSAWMIYETQSKTAAITPLLAIALVAAAWRRREALARHARRAFWIGVAVVALGVLAVVGHGLYHGGLPGNSLTFRWDYWVGAMRVVARHVILGVGLDNFGDHYLGVRLPRAAEEPKDPHNFLVHFLVELGAVGAVLCIAWVGRAAWELTRPIAPADGIGRAPRFDGAHRGQAERLTGAYSGPRAIWTFVLVSAVGLIVNVVASVDFSTDAGYVLSELLQKASMFALLLIGASIGAIKSLATPELDSRPAPILLYGVVAAAAVFLVHNLIDFSLFEAGPLTVFSFVLGSALGVRQPSMAGRKKRTAVAAVGLGVASVAWLVAAGFVWAPTAEAEDAAADATAARRLQRPAEAIRLLGIARDHQRLNADYPARAGEVMIATNWAYPKGVLEMLEAAIKANPMSAGPYLTRARYLSHAADAAAHAAQIKDDYRRAIDLNPNDAQTRVEFADVLAGLGSPDDRREAVRQYEEAVRYNALLRPDEPKRWDDARVAGIRAKAEKLKG